MKKSTSKLRWLVAQYYERKFWRQWFRNSMDPCDTKWLLLALRHFKLCDGQDFGDEILVDIGSGPVGLLTRLKARQRIAVDPLGIRTKDWHIKRIKAPGENIPLPANYADRVFIYNTLQHVQSPSRVLAEAARIAKEKTGLIYIVEQLGLPTDGPHPHSLRRPLFEDWLKKCGPFEILWMDEKLDCWFAHPHAPGSGYSILCMCVRKLKTILEVSR